MEKKLIKAFKEAVVKGNSKWLNDNEIHVITDATSDIGILMEKYNCGIAGLDIPPTYYIKDFTQNVKYKIEKPLYDELEGIFDQNYEI